MRKCVVNASDIKFNEYIVVGKRDSDEGVTTVFEPSEPAVPILNDEMDLDDPDETSNKVPDNSSPERTTDRLVEKERSDDLDERIHEDTVDCTDHADVNEEASAIGSLRPGNIPQSIESTTFRRSSRIGRRTLVHGKHADAVSVAEQGIPITYRSALKHYEHAKWMNAIRVEFRPLEENETWTFVPEKYVPSGKKIIGCKWVFRMKTNPEGGHGFKARLVIKGYEQVEGLDFGETFAPVAKHVSFRMMIALAASEGWSVDHMEVVTAFLNPEIDEEVYMEIPEGIDWLKPSVNGTCLICKLRKALYGLK